MALRDIRPSDDRDLTERLRAALSPLELADLYAEVRDGIAYLSGAVPTELDRHRARELAREVPDVTDVVDDSVVDADAVVGMSDDASLDPVSNADLRLADSARVAGTEIDLNDEIGTTDPAEAAEGDEPYYPPTDPVVRPIDRVDGDIEIIGGFAAGSLDSPIEAEPGPARLQTGDDEIAQDVRLALRSDAGTTDLRIRVVVRDGVVVLRGTVPTLDDVELAEEVAGRVAGVVEVQEELEVEGL